MLRELQFHGGNQTILVLASKAAYDEAAKHIGFSPRSIDYKIYRERQARA